MEYIILTLGIIGMIVGYVAYKYACKRLTESVATLDKAIKEYDNAQASRQKAASTYLECLDLLNRIKTTK